MSKENSNNSSAKKGKADADKKSKAKTSPETKPAADSTPAQPAKPKIAVRKRRDGSIRAFILNADTDSPRVVMTYKALKWLLNILAVLAFVYVFLASFYYVTTVAKSEFHSDCTDTIMWANASYESGKVYDPDFVYACFLPFGTNLLMQPFLGIFGLSMTTHIIGMTLFFLILSACFFFMMKFTGSDFKGCCFGTAAFLGLTLSSEKLREIFWGHTIYYTLGLLFLIFAVMMYFRIISLIRKRQTAVQKGEKTSVITARTVICCCILCLFIMFAGTDGISAISIFFLPFTAAVAAEHFVNSDTGLLSKKTLKVAVQVIVFSVMTILGILINNAWKGDLKAGYQDANSVYSAMNTWPDHLRNLPMAWLDLFGVKNLEGEKLMAGKGLVNLFYIFAALLLAALPVVATYFYSRYSKKDKALRMWVWIHWAVSAIVLLGYICGVLFGANWRITPVMGTAMILSILFVRWALAQKTTISRMAFILFLPAIIVCFINVKNTFSTPKDAYKENNVIELARVLEDNKLDKGYATFWNCNSIAVASSNNIKIREVTVDDNGINKRFYQSSKKWFDDIKADDECFLLVTQSEYNTICEKFPDYSERASQILDVSVNNAPYHIFVYDNNIF